MRGIVLTLLIVASVSPRRAEASLEALKNASFSAAWQKALEDSAPPPPAATPAPILLSSGDGIFTYKSGFYSNTVDARRAMLAVVAHLKEQRSEVLDYAVLKDERTRSYFYQVRYRPRR